VEQLKAVIDAAGCLIQLTRAEAFSLAHCPALTTRWYTCEWYLCMADVCGHI